MRVNFTPIIYLGISDNPTSLNYRCQTGLIQSNNHVHAWQLANLVIAASCKMKNIKITPADLSTVNNNLTELPMGEIQFSTKDVVVPLHL